jgi:LacI family sucrose operon transcriptional repressor
MNKTIADIARMAGVAKSTVSRFLNGGAVSVDTRRKIEKVVKATGYVPNTFAQSLKAKRTNIIGTVVPRLDSFATSHTLMGIDEELRAQHYQMLISNTSQDVKREIEALYELGRQKISGIILLAAQITDEHLTAIRDIRIPVLLVGQQHEQIHSLIHDDYRAGYDIGAYVLSQGHREIAYVGVTEKDVAVGVRRKEGFKQAVRDALPHQAHMDDVKQLEQAAGYDIRYYETGFKMSDARVAASAILDGFKPSLMVCATDNIALGVINAAYSRGIAIPSELSVTGFGGYDITEVIHPALTTVQYPYMEAGRVAAQNIVRLVEHKPVEKVTVMNYSLVERESVDKR